MLLLLSSVYQPLRAQQSQPDSQGSLFTEEEKKWLSEHRRIPIGVDGNWPPIDFFDDDNRFHGITADYLALIGEKIGVEFIPQRSETFKAMLNKVMRGELKVGATIAFKQERTNRLLFTRPFFHVQKVIITRKEIRDISGIKALYGKTVAIEDGFLTMRLLQERHPEIRLLPVESTLKALKAVSFAKADAYVGNQAVAAWISQKNQLINLKIAADPDLGRAPQNFAVTKSAADWAPLIGILDKTLASITPAEKIHIESRWLGQIDTLASAIPDLKLSNREKTWLRQHTDISLGVDAAWQPLEYIDEQGQYQGLSSDFMHYFSRQMGLTFKSPEKLSWSDVVERLKNKTIDLAPLLIKTEKRAEFLDFTQPYLNFPVVIFNQQGQTLLNGLTDLTDSKVGLVKGYAISELIAKDYPAMQQVFFPTTEQGLEALSLGKIDAFIDLLAVGGYLMATSGLSNLQVAASTPYTHDFAIGVRKDWPELVTILNRAIELLPIQRKNEFLKKWLVLRYQQKIDYRLLFLVIGVTLVIFVLFIFHTRKMTRVNAELQRANQAVERSSQIKGQFLANMSHEIRTPMNAIVGLGHLMSRTSLDEKQQDYMSNLQKSAQTLLGLIDDILDLSKIEAGHLNIERIEFNLEDMLIHLAEISMIRMSSKKVEFIYDMEPRIPWLLMGDPFRINQILTNLVSNAIKFTPSGNIVLRVRIKKQTESNIWLLFEVSDTGIGIAAENMHKLFEPFIQEDGTTTRKFGGTGLGLSISRELSEMMGGEMGAESSPGKGSKFYFELPFTVPTRQPSKSHFKNSSQDLYGLKVLLVDDNPESLRILSHMLESMSFFVTQVPSGHQALAKLKLSDERFDLVLLDWRMPQLNGEKTALLIRQQIPKEKLPIIIMMTAYGRESTEQKINHLPLDGFLVKPITPSQLFDAIIRARKDAPDTVTKDKMQEGVTQTSMSPLIGHVLLAEDNEINQQVVKEILEQMGVVVSICVNGLEVLSELETHNPDLILMDIQMPEMDGYETTREIRKMSKYANLPIIALTANAMAEDNQKSLQAGMNRHISKPVNPEVLYQTLAYFLKTADAKSETDIKTVDKNAFKNWPDEVPGLNIKQGIKQVGGNEKLYQKLLKDFVSNHRNIGQSLAQLVAEGELEKATRSVHTIKGVAGNIGAKRLQHIASQINQIFVDNEAIPEHLIISYNDASDELFASLHQLLDSNDR